MTDDPNKPPQKAPTWEGDPEGFLRNLGNDPVWVNAQQQRKELREKFNLPDRPKLEDFPDHASWSAAWDLNEDHFDEVTGYRKRVEEISKLCWSGEYDEGFGTEGDFRDIASRLNYRWGKCSLDDVIREWRKKNAN